MTPYLVTGTADEGRQAKQGFGQDERKQGNMDMNLLKKALPKGLLAGICVTLVYALVRTLTRGGAFVDHLFSTNGIITLICIPAAWVFIYYNREKEKTKQ